MSIKGTGYLLCGLLANKTKKNTINLRQFLTVKLYDIQPYRPYDTLLSSQKIGYTFSK